MRQFKGVRSTAETVNPLCINVDTVYVRENIVEVNEQSEQQNFKGWQYDEMQYDKNEYLQKMANCDNLSEVVFLVTLLMSEIDMLKKELELIKNE